MKRCLIEPKLEEFTSKTGLEWIEYGSRRRCLRTLRNSRKSQIRQKHVCAHHGGRGTPNQGGARCPSCGGRGWARDFDHMHLFRSPASGRAVLATQPYGSKGREAEVARGLEAEAHAFDPGLRAAFYGWESWHSPDAAVYLIGDPEDISGFPKKAPAKKKRPAPPRSTEEKIERAIALAAAGDPVEAMLGGPLRPLTPEDVLGFSVHWLGPVGQAGRIAPLHETDRLRPKPLRAIRGFLHRLDAGLIHFKEVEAGGEEANRMRGPGRASMTEINSFSAGLGRIPFEKLPWKSRHLRRDGFLKAASADTVIRWWLDSKPFWRGPSGPHCWKRADGTGLVLTNCDGWGCPVFEEAVIVRPAAAGSGAGG